MKQKNETKSFNFAGYQISDRDGHLAVERGRVDLNRVGDYGADPLQDGMFRMVPSGDVVDFEERCRRLGCSK